jgi:glycosyltransferase involved in cell wall biosynthesis
MKIAYITEYNVLDKTSWSKNHQGLCAAGSYIAQQLTEQDVSIHYIGVLAKKHKFVTRAKWSLYRHIYKKDYYRWAEPLVSKNYAYQIEQRLKLSNANIALCPENIVPIAYLDCKQPLVLWTDATMSSLIKFYRHMDNLCEENINNIYEMEAAALNRCDLIMYTSDWAAQTAIKTYGIDSSKVKVIPWGANFECNRTLDDIHTIIKAKNPSPCKLLFIGVDWVRKGGDTALQVAKELNENGLETELIIIGCKPEVKEPLPGTVKVIEFIDKSKPQGIEHLNKLFTEAHFLILPTQADCTPHVFAEANSYGVPSLATNVGGISTIIQDNLNGKTFSLSSNISEYCEYVHSLMENYDNYVELALSSFEQYQARLNWKVAVERAKHFMNELVD